MIKSLFAALTDHHIELPEDDFTKPINYVMAKNGCFEVRDTPLGRMTVRVEDEIAGLNTEMDEGIELDIPLIPGKILTTILEFFRAVYHEKNGAEAFLQVFYNEEEDEFFLHCPKQEVSGALVTFERDPELEARHVLVMDIHSHNSMPAFFSTIDDEDEQEDRLYGVIGCVHQRLPHMSFRLGVAGRFVEMEGKSLFGEAEPAMNWPQAWLDQCEYAPFGHHRRAGKKEPEVDSTYLRWGGPGKVEEIEKTKDEDESTTSFGKSPDSFGSSFSSLPRRSSTRSSFSSRRRRRVESWGPEWDEVLSNAGEWVEDVQPYKPMSRRFSI
ncbi:MAG: hypothetical protein EP343_22250 [Deltaproteobacteria bacterium]|nr:MAG: hypothetical protein EP343_22250 [Deltaproteobacteria bacterium]